MLAGNVCSGKSEMPEPSRQHSQEQRMGVEGGGEEGTAPLWKNCKFQRLNMKCILSLCWGLQLGSFQKQTSHPSQRLGSPSLPTTSVYTKEGC